MTRMHRVVVGPLPCWLDREQLLAVPHTATELPMGDVEVSAELTSLQAADLAARLRGLCLAARPIQVRCEPPLPRAAVRSARAEDARRRRETTAGFERRGVLVDDPEGRWSLTPEALALEMAGLAGQCSVCDAMCGLGGNAIAFARAGCEVTAIELDAARLARARHNARVYGVLERIRFIHGDARSLLGDMDAALLFLDPPWGVKWNRHGVRLPDLPLLRALLERADHFQRIWLKLPPAFDERGLSEYRPQAVFGKAPGDQARVKFLWLQR